MLELLDMHGVKRSAIYSQVAAAFRDRLIPLLETLKACQCLVFALPP